jgi:hypothetical protein
VTTKSGPLPANDPRHGTTNGYSNLDCRCQPCRDAHAAACNVRRAKRVALLAAGKLLVIHGTNNAYTHYGCRCMPCTEARRARAVEEWRRRALDRVSQ